MHVAPQTQNLRILLTPPPRKSAPVRRPREMALGKTSIKLCRFEDTPARMAARSFRLLVIRSALPYAYFSGVVGPWNV